MAATFYIDTKGFKMAGVSAGLSYEYADGNRTDKVTGSYVEVAVINKGYEKIRVNLDSTVPLLGDGEEFAEGAMIEFDNLQIRPYVNRQNRLAYTAHADAARVLKPAMPNLGGK